MRALRCLHLLAPVALVSALAACGDDSGSSSGAGGGTGGSASTTASAGATTGAGVTSSGSGEGGAGATTSSSAGTTGASTSSGTGGASASFADLCAEPGVVFCDAFEGAWDDTWIEDGGDVSVVDGAAIDGEGSTVLQLSTHGDVQSSKLLRTFDGLDVVHVRFDVQYADDYDNGGGSHGPILGGSDAPPWGMLGTAGMKPDGSDFFVLNFEPIGTVGEGGELGFYAYFVNMQPDGNGDYWGNVFESTAPSPPVIVPGQWHCAEYAIALNAPSAEDGSASFWFDGVAQGTFGGIQWRTDEALQVSTLALDSYNHMREGPIPEETPNRVLYDNLVISTAPVGCLQP
jgi:hypothetical protein